MDDEVIGPRQNPDHPLAKVGERTGRDPALLARWVDAIERKGQAIFVGAPGVGKSYIARELARHLVGGGDGFTRQLVLHASTTYEDFVQGYRPVLRSDGSTHWPLVRGRFLHFVDKAFEKRDRCVLILDEVHRADLGRVLGELVHLLEYRNEPIPLIGAERPFILPTNVRILGTMSASAEMGSFDPVLRRRFAFIRVDADPDVLRRYHADTGFAVEGLSFVLQRIAQSLRDPTRALGFSYFLRVDLSACIEDVWRFEVEPMLESLFADRPAELTRFRWEVVGYRILGSAQNAQERAADVDRRRR